jgi:hypothetical protein
MVVHVEDHYLLRLVPERIRPAVLLVEHNIESALFEQRAAYCTAPAERAEALRESARTRIDELAAWRQVRVVGVVTEEDAGHLSPDSAALSQRHPGDRGLRPTQMAGERRMS